MGFHNPFLKDGLIKFPDNGSVVKHVEKWAKVRGDKLAYRFLDFSVERDGVALREMGPGASFGELALLANIARTATVTTTTPSRLVIIGAREFAALRHDHPEIESSLLKTVAERLAKLEQDRPH